jgi:hypothetical protein
VDVGDVGLEAVGELVAVRVGGGQHQHELLVDGDHLVADRLELRRAAARPAPAGRQPAGGGARKERVNLA